MVAERVERPRHERPKIGPPYDTFDRWKQLINSLTQLREYELAERVRMCGAVRGKYDKEHPYCHCRLCPFCSWRAGIKRERTYRAALRRCRTPYLITLSLPRFRDAKWDDPKAQYRLIGQVLKRLFDRAYWRKNIVGYYRSIEPDYKHEQWSTHVHIVANYVGTDAWFEVVQWCRDNWLAILADYGYTTDGPHAIKWWINVDVRMLDPTDPAILGYMLKPPPIHNRPALIRQYLDTFSGQRLLVPSGSFRWKSPRHSEYYYKQLEGGTDVAVLPIWEPERPPTGLIQKE